MIAALWAWAMGHPTLACVAALMVWLMLAVLATCVFSLARTAPNAADESAPPPDDAPAFDIEATARKQTSLSHPIPWERSGGNWWPIP